MAPPGSLGKYAYDWGRGANFKMTAKSAKTAIFENREFLRNPADRTKIALARPIFEQMTSNLLHLKGMSYICVIVAQNWALYLILRLKFGSEVKNSKI